MLSRYEAGSGLDIRRFLPFCGPTLAWRVAAWGVPFCFLLIILLVCQRTSNLDFSGCFDFRRTATAVNDVQNFNTFRLDTVNDQASAMSQVSVHAGFSRDETTDGMMKIFRRKLIEFLEPYDLPPRRSSADREVRSSFSMFWFFP